MTKKYIDSQLRSLAKALNLRLNVFIVMTIIILYNGGTIMQSLELSVLDVCVELTLHYIYERVWQRINWGLIEEEENIIKID